MARKKTQKSKKTSSRGKPRRGGRKPGKWELVSPEGIKTYRTQRGISRAKLATLLGVSTTSIQNWEAGRPASLKIQRQLRDLLDGGGAGASPGDSPTPQGSSQPSQDAAVIQTTGAIVSAYLQSQKTALAPEQLARLVRGVRQALL